MMGQARGATQPAEPALAAIPTGSAPQTFGQRGPPRRARSTAGGHATRNRTRRPEGSSTTVEQRPSSQIAEQSRARP